MNSDISSVAGSVPQTDSSVAGSVPQTTSVAGSVPRAVESEAQPSREASELFYSSENHGVPPETPSASENNPESGSEKGGSGETREANPQPDNDAELKSGRAERRIRELQARIKELETRNTAAPGRAASPSAKPKVDDFDTLEAYETAIEKYHSEQAVAKAKEEQRKADEAAALQKRQADFKAAWEKKLTATRQRDPKFDDRKALELIEPTAAMAEFIADSDIGPDIMRHLAANEAEAERIRGLSPIRQVRELDKIEAKIQGELKGIKPAASPKPAAVPNYVEPGGASQTVLDPVALFYPKG